MSSMSGKLLKEDEALKEEYWSENRFAPLL